MRKLITTTIIILSVSACTNAPASPPVTVTATAIIPVTRTATVTATPSSTPPSSTPASSTPASNTPANTATTAAPNNSSNPCEDIPTDYMSVGYPDNFKAYLCSEYRKGTKAQQANTIKVLALPYTTWETVANGYCASTDWTKDGVSVTNKATGGDQELTSALLLAVVWIYDCSLWR